MLRPPQLHTYFSRMPRLMPSIAQTRFPKLVMLGSTRNDARSRWINFHVEFRQQKGFSRENRRLVTCWQICGFCEFLYTNQSRCIPTNLYRVNPWKALINNSAKVFVSLPILALSP
jgi:hypothetical protein